MDGKYNTDSAVVLRRNAVAEKYFSGMSPLALRKWYTKQFGLTINSLEADITIVRKEIQLNYDFNELWENEVRFLYTLRDKALNNKDEDGNENGNEDINTLLQTSRQIANLIKLINPNSKTSIGTVNINQNNISVPDLSIDEIKSLLNQNENGTNNDDPTIIEI